MKEILNGCFGFMGIILVSFLGFFLIDFILAFFVMWCCDFVMPSLFGLSQITYWQSFVLLLLLGMLFPKNITVRKYD